MRRRTQQSVSGVWRRVKFHSRSLKVVHCWLRQMWLPVVKNRVLRDRYSASKCSSSLNRLGYAGLRLWFGLQFDCLFAAVEMLIKGYTEIDICKALKDVRCLHHLLPELKTLPISSGPLITTTICQYANMNCTNVLLLSAVFLILIISKIVFIVTVLWFYVCCSCLLLYSSSPP